MVRWWKNVYASEERETHGIPSASCNDLYDGSTTVDLYSLLGVGVMASEEELRRSWKKKAFEHHPDRHAGDPNSTIRFQAIQHAYNVLKDKNKRNEYDKALLHRFYAEEYLYRCADLILTSSGLGLPIHSCARYKEQSMPCREKIASDSRFFLTAHAASRSRPQSTSSSF